MIVSQRVLILVGFQPFCDNDELDSSEFLTASGLSLSLKCLDVEMLNWMIQHSPNDKRKRT